ncbi:MAG TPA: hypothetical protein VM347_01365 [Nonomuraea sp.]|nr:hypothetical protein [Nonomuraea sp.]
MLKEPHQRTRTSSAPLRDLLRHNSKNWMIPLFLLMETRDDWLFAAAIIVLTVGLGLSYGQMSAMYAEMFPVSVHYSGVAIGYALGAILGGAFAPTIAQALVQSTGSALSVGASIMVLCVISLAAVMAVKEPKPRWRAHAPPVRS